MLSLNRDVARRHVSKCSPDGHSIELPKEKRGKRRQACDRCSQLKVSCDANSPCQRCCTREAACTYKRLLPYTSPRRPLSVASNHRSSVDQNRLYGRIPISFLMEFTDPSPYATSTAIAEVSIEQTYMESEITHSYLQPSDNSFTTGMFFWDLGDGFISLVDMFSSESVEEYSSSQYDPLFQLQGSVVLESRMSDIVSQLSITNSMLRSRHGFQGDFNIQLAESVFTVANLRHFVRVYFDRFHGHIPIIHRPTFNIESASLPLLLALFLFGSQCSVPLDLATSTQKFLDIVEEFVFSHPTFGRSFQYDHEARSTSDTIQALQAALLVQIMQNSTNDITAQRRSRLERYPCLVTAVRLSGLFRVRRRCSLQDPAGFNWQQFIFDEMRIRIAIWTFLTDTIFAMFFNSPPGVAISEMIGDFPCPEEFFEADTAPRFEQLASLESIGAPPPSPSDFVSSCFEELGPDPQDLRYRGMTVFHLLVTICALQSITIVSRSSLLSQATAGTILRATDTWKVFWDTVTKSEDFKLHRQTALGRHATEFWWLTRTILKVGQLRDQSCRYMNIAPTETVKDLHDFICKYKDM
ncbi:fungal-specific transcription factor domain-containing protein [Xylogone sp. PMI_703]|nr:fungal-specific transcription factor domain-containing protein [Xylogone sp. PMI_703]